MPLLLVGTAAVGTCAARSRPPDERPRLAIVGFQNLAGEPEAEETTMELVRLDMVRRGFRLTGMREAREFLRAERIRVRNALTLDQIRALAERSGADYVLMGTIVAWHANGGPEVGLAARLVDPDDGRLLWSDTAGLHAVEAPGVLALGRPASLEAAARKVVKRLFEGLVLRRVDGRLRPQRRSRSVDGHALGQDPVVYRSPSLDPRVPFRVALIPFQNRSGQAGAPGVIAEHLLASLLSVRGVKVVDPGELRRVLIERDIQPLYGLGLEKLAILREDLGVDAVLDGTIFAYEGVDGDVPRIDLHARLRATSTGEILWSAAVARDGEESRTFFDLGRIRGIDRLSRVAIDDLLSTWFR